MRRPEFANRRGLGRTRRRGGRRHHWPPERSRSGRCRHRRSPRRRRWSRRRRRARQAQRRVLSRRTLLPQRARLSGQPVLSRILNRRSAPAKTSGQESLPARSASTSGEISPPRLLRPPPGFPTVKRARQIRRQAKPTNTVQIQRRSRLRHRG